MSQKLHEESLPQRESRKPRQYTKSPPINTRSMTPWDEELSCLPRGKGVNGKTLFSLSAALTPLDDALAMELSLLCQEPSPFPHLNEGPAM